MLLVQEQTGLVRARCLIETRNYGRYLAEILVQAPHLHPYSLRHLRFFFSGCVREVPPNTAKSSGSSMKCSDVCLRVCVHSADSVRPLT
jgi:hypothetical protein